MTAAVPTRTATEMPEWSTRVFPDVELTDSDRRLVAALGAGDARLVVDELRDGVRVMSRSWIGVVRFETFEVRVIPKVAGGNLGVLHMLEYASGLSALSRLESARTIQTAKESHLADLLGLLLAEATSRLVRDGLLSDYVTREESLTILRGRLRMNDQVRRRHLQVDRLECRFDEHETDIVENRLLGAALAIARRVCADEEVRRSVSRYHAVLNEVCEPGAFDPQSAELELVYHRRNEHYRTAHELAWLFVRALAVSDLYAPGSRGSFAFLIDMNRLFERFVTCLLTDALAGSGMSVRPQFRDQTLIVEEPLLRRYAAIVPDILLESSDADGRRRIPVDAKYELYDEGKVDPADVYQTFVYAYARRIDQELDQVRAVILYPASHRGGEGTRLLVRRASGATSARIAAVPVDIHEALRAVKERRVRGLPLIRSLLGYPLG